MRYPGGGTEARRRGTRPIPVPSAALRARDGTTSTGLGLGRDGYGRRVPAVISREGALYLGHLGPIPLYVHWTFLFLVWMIMPSGAFQGGDALMRALIVFTVLVVGIVLHELGHGMAAKAQGEYGITITLWAFGGVCSSTRSGRPWRELVIVLAGPVVSAILAIGCYVAIMVLGDQAPHLLRDGSTHSILALFLLYGYHVNLTLLIFNMLPIFPLDGGQAVHNIMLMFLRRQLANRISMAVAIIGSIVYVGWRMHERGGEPDLFLIALLGFMLYNAHLYLNQR